MGKWDLMFTEEQTRYILEQIIGRSPEEIDTLFMTTKRRGIGFIPNVYDILRVEESGISGYLITIQH